MALYTSEELITLIKQIDIDISSGVTRSDLDTSQTKQSFSQSLAQLSRQREYYLRLLKTVDPTTYKSFMGPSAIRFGGSGC